MFQKRKEWNPLSSNKLVAKITAPLKFWKKYENHLKISSQGYERLIMTQCLSNIWRTLWFCRLSHWSCFFKSYVELNLTCHSRGQSHCDVNAVAHVNSVKMTYGGRGERRAAGAIATQKIKLHFCQKCALFIVATVIVYINELSSTTYFFTSHIFIKRHSWRALFIIPVFFFTFSMCFFKVHLTES